MNENTSNCPICPRHCDLSAPHCGRGAEYAKTGNLPEGWERAQEPGHDKHNGQRHGSQGHGHEHGHGGHEHSRRIQFEKREQQLIMKYLHHAVGAADQGGLTQDNAGEMFSVLTEEETLQLAGLLEKLSDHWMVLAPHMPAKHPSSQG